MNGRRTIVGLCMLCALLVSAFAAQSASAITGTTAFTCVKNAQPENRVGEHCLDIPGTRNYGHVAIAQDKTTEIKGTNEKTESETTKSRVGRLKLTIAGVPLELSATGVSGEGWMENKVNASGEHYAHGKGTITFTGVQVTTPGPGRCTVTTDNAGAEGAVGVVHTRELTATTEGQGHNLQFTPAAVGPFATFWITCNAPQIPALEGKWECTGSAKGQPNGATTEFAHSTVTTENTLKCKGTKSGIDGALTLSGREKGSTGAYNPLAATTVTT
ncbi:MAG TPA: hypothetical protein VF081_00125 [Solirubrobacterales bacterium]